MDPLYSDKTQLNETAQRAVKKFRSMQPTLTAFVVALTRNSRARVEITASGPHTTGDVVYYRPPLSLGRESKHDRALCDTRDRVTLLQLCSACAVEEDVYSTIYHEIAHIVFGSFARVSDHDAARAVERALSQVSPKYADEVRARVENAPRHVKQSYNGLASLMSPFMPMLIQVIEDTRVEARMFESRPGMKKMFAASNMRTFRDGLMRNDGTVSRWSDAPLNAQVIIGLLCLGAGYDFKGWFHPDAEVALADPTLNELMGKATTATKVAESYSLSFLVLHRLQQLGFCKSDTDPEDEEQPNDDEPADTDPVDSTPDTDDTESGDSEDDSQPEEPEVEDDDTVERDSDGTGDSDDPGTDRPDNRSDQGEGEQPKSGDDPSDPGEEESSESEDAGSGAPNDSDDAGGNDSQDTPSSSDTEEGGSDADADDAPGSGGSGSEQDSGPGDTPRNGEPDDQEPGDGPGDDVKAPQGGEAMEPSDSSQREGNAGDRGEREASGSDGSEADRDSSGGSTDVASGDDQGSSEGDGSVDEDGAGGGDDQQESDDEGDSDPVPGERRDGSGGRDADEDRSRPESDGSPSETVEPSTSQGGEQGHLPSVDERSEPAETETSDESGHEESLETDGSVVDSGAFDESQIGHSDAPPTGEASDIDGVIEEFVGHSEVHEVVEEAEQSGGGKAESVEDKALNIAVVQGQYFETPSVKVESVTINRYGVDSAPGWRGYQRLDRSDRLRAGIESEVDIPESILGPATLVTRRTFDDNKRATVDRNRKSGRIRGAALAKRAPFDDPRMFGKRTLPGKKSYSVLIGIDVSLSTVGVNLALAKRAAFAQAELCHRTGIDFSIWCHSSGRRNGTSLEMYLCKDWNDPWDEQRKDALRNINAVSGNLDGHSIEFYRKAVERTNATDKIILYYSDGKMPAENHDEELIILKREILYCKRNGIELMGVGIRTDSPRRHGLDTVQIDTDEDLVKVVQHLGKKLNASR
jgi:hypothetical protein